MPNTRHRNSGSAPIGAIVVRIVRAGDEIVGFIGEIEEPGENGSSYPSEQKPIDQVWRLVESKLETMPNTQVYVEIEAGVDWKPEGGSLR